MKKEGRIQGEYEKLVPSNFWGITRRGRGRERLMSFFPRYLEKVGNAQHDLQEN